MKSTIKNLSRTEAAKQIKESVEAIDLSGWLPQASVWEKYGKVRIYCKDNGKDEGFIEIADNGKLSYEKRRNSRQYKYIDAIRAIVDNFSLTIEPETKQQSFREIINNLSSNPNDKFEWSAKEWCFGAPDEESF